MPIRPELRWFYPIDWPELSRANPDGSAIELRSQDIHISVDGLITAILPAILPLQAIAAVCASRGSQATPKVKRSSAQENGRRGDRPRKPAKALPAIGAE